MGVFAITGNLASGKSTVLKLLKRKGAMVFDVDRRIHIYYRNKRSNLYREIVSLFPQTSEGGVISRKKLAKIVFSHKDKLQELEKIVHPVIIKDLKDWVDKAKGRRIYAAEVPLLFEKKLSSYFDGTILIYVKRNVLIERIRKKFNFSKKKAQKRLSLYLPIKEKIKGSDFIIDNSTSFKKLKEQVNSLWRGLKSKE